MINTEPLSDEEAKEMAQTLFNQIMHFLDKGSPSEAQWRKEFSEKFPSTYVAELKDVLQEQNPEAMKEKFLADLNQWLSEGDGVHTIWVRLLRDYFTALP